MAIAGRTVLSLKLGDCCCIPDMPLASANVADWCQLVNLRGLFDLWAARCPLNAAVASVLHPLQTHPHPHPLPTMHWWHASRKRAATGCLMLVRHPLPLSQRSMGWAAVVAAPVVVPPRFPPVVSFFRLVSTIVCTSVSSAVSSQAASVRWFGCLACVPASTRYMRLLPGCV